MTDLAATEARRGAQIHIGAKGETRAVRVSHPGQLTPKEIAKIDDLLINDVIKPRYAELIC